MISRGLWLTIVSTPRQRRLLLLLTKILMPTAQVVNLDPTYD